jgi:hypothetical protein
MGVLDVIGEQRSSGHFFPTYPWNDTVLCKGKLDEGIQRQGNWVIPSIIKAHFVATVTLTVSKSICPVVALRDVVEVRVFE